MPLCGEANQCLFGEAAHRSPSDEKRLPCFILAIRRIDKNIRLGLYNVKFGLNFSKRVTR
jgi:hypothetical protein